MSPPILTFFFGLWRSLTLHVPFKSFCGSMPCIQNCGMAAQEEKSKHPSHILYYKVAVVCWLRTYVHLILLLCFWYFQGLKLFFVNAGVTHLDTETERMAFHLLHWVVAFLGGWLGVSPPSLASEQPLHDVITHYHILTTVNVGNLTPEARLRTLQCSSITTKHSHFSSSPHSPITTLKTYPNMSKCLALKILDKKINEF